MSRDNSSSGKPAASPWDMMLSQVGQSLAPSPKAPRAAKPGKIDEKETLSAWKTGKDGVLELPLRQLSIAKELIAVMDAAKRMKQEFVRVIDASYGIRARASYIIIWDPEVIKNKSSLLDEIDRVSINRAGNRYRRMREASKGQRAYSPCGLVTLSREQNAKRFNQAVTTVAIDKRFELAQQDYLQRGKIIGIMAPFDWKP